MSAEEWAWAAGLFEGEGCIHHGDRKPNAGGGRYRSLALAMTDEEPVRRFGRIVGVGTVRWRAPAKPGRKEAWHWSCTRWPDIEAVLQGLMPYLGPRRTAKATALLEDPAQPPPADRTHCAQGHPYRGDNLRVTAEGHRVCRTCVCERTKRFRERQRDTTDGPVNVCIP